MIGIAAIEICLLGNLFNAYLKCTYRVMQSRIFTLGFIEKAVFHTGRIEFNKVLTFIWQCV